LLGGLGTLLGVNVAIALGAIALTCGALSILAKTAALRDQGTELDIAPDQAMAVG
jgi:hypothetical protein